MRYSNCAETLCSLRKLGLNVPELDRSALMSVRSTPIDAARRLKRARSGCSHQSDHPQIIVIDRIRISMLLAPELRTVYVTMNEVDSVQFSSSWMSGVTSPPAWAAGMGRSQTSILESMSTVIEATAIIREVPCVQRTALTRQVEQLQSIVSTSPQRASAALKMRILFSGIIAAAKSLCGDSVGVLHTINEVITCLTNYAEFSVSLFLFELPTFFSVCIREHLLSELEQISKILESVQDVYDLCRPMAKVAVRLVVQARAQGLPLSNRDVMDRFSSAYLRSAAAASTAAEEDSRRTLSTH